MKYCRSVNIPEVLIFANFARRTNSRIQESRENYYYNSATEENGNSRILNFVKSPKIRKSRKFKLAKITRSTVTQESYPRKHETSIQCWVIVGPAS